ncbi:MAG TPA: hypothetical protein VNS58_08760 [Puia sp.]|nr:hypothetical protein [Puia sp.]
MSLNNIELGDLIVSELYRNSLLATDAAALPARPSVPKAPAGPGPDPETKSARLSTPGPDLPAGSAQATPTRPDSNPETSAPVNPAVRTSAPPAVPVSPVSAPSASETKSAPPAGAPVADGGYKFLGNNRRKITVLVESPGVAFLPDDQLSFLTRMLEACKMNVGDVAIVNLANAPVTITALKQQLQPNMILLFGMEPVAIRLPMNFPWFKIQAYDECTYLCAPSLEELVLPGDESRLLKSKLWMCLKTLFEI